MAVKLYFDAGHGGKDSGAVGNGLYEKNIVLTLAKKTEEIVKANYKNIEVMQTRTSDIFLSLDERTDKANKWGADIFVSFHCNASTSPTARGFETYIYPQADARTRAFQNVIHSEIWNQISKTAGVTDKGKKQANFHVLRESSMVALLSENLFVSNSSDADLLKQENFLDKLAWGHAIGLEKFLGLQKVDKPIEQGLFQVVTGTFSTKDNAEKRVAQLKKDGYESYIIEKK